MVGRFGAPKPKNRKRFLVVPPNRPARPIPYQTRNLETCRHAPRAELAQLLSRTPTERFPNPDPGPNLAPSAHLCCATSEARNSGNLGTQGL